MLSNDSLTPLIELRLDLHSMMITQRCKQEGPEEHVLKSTNDSYHAESDLCACSEGSEGKCGLGEWDIPSLPPAKTNKRFGSSMGRSTTNCWATNSEQETKLVVNHFNRLLTDCPHLAF